MFLIKQPSVKSHVLNYELCPPLDLMHDLDSYSAYYDPLYYPHYHPEIFSTPENFCAWLQASLSFHGDVCGSCRPLYKSTAVIYDGSALCVHVDDTSMMLACSHFESPLYSHCSVFHRHASFHIAATSSPGAHHVSAASCMAAHVDDDPGWFTYPDDCVRSHLLALSAPILSSAMRPLCQRRSLVPCNKNNCIDFIMRHFSAHKTQLSVLMPDDFLDHLTSTVVPFGCPRTRVSILAAKFQNLYSEQVASALRAPPDVVGVYDVPTVLSAASVSISMPWLTVSLDDLTRRLEKLSRAEIQLCLHRLPSTF
ncbi:uncharacterized protein F5147DRAFT_778221 [Suillus discolor]|uniref:Uncharacterized protein n=1 Tax=Suillus discolor TaxID=1912936 RepID=A0A9P7EXU0_9AGAM|nr:uncharacterized protein F5147DRAFT_778221 [Suillus discolor]KAG2096713.1 hypothetical protein F5147DRAFT_778221 [Suillus discolor]